MLKRFFLSKKEKASTRNTKIIKEKIISKVKYAIKGKSHPHTIKASRKFEI